MISDFHSTLRAEGTYSIMINRNHNFSWSFHPYQYSLTSTMAATLMSFHGPVAEDCAA
jgi:hypothetical protein